MEKKITIPHIPFYFVRHGETDWNKINQALCPQDDIPLNETGLLQAIHAREKLNSLNITKIYSSPLVRAKQTAEIINEDLQVHLEFHTGLREISHERVAAAFAELLDPSHTMLMVSHGEVYRVLLRILNALAIDPNAHNGGVYFFSPPRSSADQWVVHTITKIDQGIS